MIVKVSVYIVFFIFKFTSQSNYKEIN